MGVADQGSAWWSRSTAALALAGVVAVVGVGAAFAVERSTDARHDRAVDRVRNGAHVATDLRISAIGDRIERYRDILAELPASTAPARFTNVVRSDFPTAAVVRPGLPLRVETAGAIGSRSDVAAAMGAPVIASAAAAARDAGTPYTTVADNRFVVVWPLYAGNPLDTDARRHQSTGWVVGVTPTSALTAGFLAVAHGFGDRVSATFSAAGPGEVHTVLRDAIGLDVMGVPGESRLPVYLIGLLTVIACASITAYGFAARRRELALRSQSAELAERLALVSAVSHTVQESLDMGHVLPAVLGQMSDSLGLSYVAVVPGPAEDGVEVFSLGRRPGLLPAQRWSPDMTTASAGQFVRLPLQRISRTLGHLEVVPTNGLDAAAFASLRSAAELLAGAMYNADLYEREQVTVRKLRELDELKDDFLSTVSHELRTPLSVLVGFASLLNSKWDRLPDEVRRDSISRMQRHLGSLTNLVNDLLDFISDRRQTIAACVPIALDETVLELTDVLEALCVERELIIDAHSPVRAWTDPRALERIVGNIVGNAAKYSAPGTTIRVSVAEGDDARVSVADEGPGIRAEDRTRIFERFYRGDSDAARGTRGSGIGLAVVLGWVRAIGARLDVASTPGQGTTITVHFPLSPDEPLDGAGTVTWLDAGTRSEELVQ